MSQNEKKHEPSFYRGLIREQKSNKGRHPKKLLGEARTLQDSYYASLALFRLSDDPRLPISEAKFVAREAIRLAENEPRLWRRAELYSKLAKHAKTWNITFSEEDSHYFLDEILSKLYDFPKGKGLSQNISEISKHIGCKRLPSLLRITIHNNDFMLDDSKTVIRQWATTCQKEVSPEEIFTILTNVKDFYLQSKLMGYLYLQCCKNQIAFEKSFLTAVNTALKTQKNEKLNALRYLSRHISSKKDFNHLQHVILDLNDSILRTQLLTTLAGHADKKGLKDFSLTVFKTAIHEAETIQKTEERRKTEFNIAKGLLKINQIELAKDLLVKNHRLTTDKSFKNAIENTMHKYSLQTNGIKPVNDSSSSDSNLEKFPSSSGHCLGLFDTYKGSIKPIHIRMVARAAPLCAAFGLDLTLIGFPIKNLTKFINKATTDTTIGKGGKYLQFLYNEKRIHLLDYTQKKNLGFSNHLIPIATTAHPEENKSITLHNAVTLIQNHPKKKLTLIMGLGKKGLPSSLLQKVEYHLELTGINVSLETSTAMGIIAMKLYEKVNNTT